MHACMHACTHTHKHARPYAHTFTPVHSKHFKAVDVKDRDDSGGSARRKICGLYSLVDTSHHQLEETLIDCL